MMVSLQEMKDCAAQIDEGIDNLELKLQDVNKLCQVSYRSSSNARDVIVQIQNDLTSKFNFIQEFLKVGLDSAEENVSTIETAESILVEIGNELQDMDQYVLNFGIEPFAKVLSNGSASNIESESSATQNSAATGSNQKFLLDESPVFGSPNYSSTPDSYSCGTSKENLRSANGSTPFLGLRGNVKISNSDRGTSCSSSQKYFNYSSNSKCFGKQSTDRGVNNRSGIRNYTPPPMLPLSARTTRSIRHYP